MTTFAIAVLADGWDFHHNSGTGGWILMTLGMLVFWGAIIALVVWFLRGAQRSGDTQKSRDSPPMEILRRRLADGSISVEEYEQRREMLESGS